MVFHAYPTANLHYTVVACGVRLHAVGRSRGLSRLPPAFVLLIRQLRRVSPTKRAHLGVPDTLLLFSIDLLLLLDIVPVAGLVHFTLWGNHRQYLSLALVILTYSPVFSRPA